MTAPAILGLHGGFLPQLHDLCHGGRRRLYRCAALPDSNEDGSIGALELTDLLVFYNTDGGGCGILNPFPSRTLAWTLVTCRVPTAEKRCTYPNAINYDPGATVEDGSCLWTGCTDPAMQNYQPLANLDDGTCVAPICWDFDFSGSVGIQDLLDLLLLFNQECGAE